MKRFYIFSTLVLTAAAAFGQGGGTQVGSSGLLITGSGVVTPPVLRGSEAAESAILTLPGTAVVPKAVTAPEPKPTPAAGDEAGPSIPADEDHRPVLRRAPKPVLPAEFERDAAAFSHQRIGEWTPPDAYNLFGEPLRRRAALDDDGGENGEILAYSDPTGRYRELELDYAKDTGLLRSVFVYPWKMTWQDCRRVWGTNVRSTEAPKGRMFYSYLNRRVDVLVDSAGKVISFGLY